MRPLLFLVLLVGCSGSLDAAKTAANAAADIGDVAEHTLADRFRREQDEAIAHAPTREAADAGRAEVRTKYAPLWRAYDAFRAAWLALAVGIRAAEAGATGLDVPGLLAQLATAEAEMAKVVGP